MSAAQDREAIARLRRASRAKVRNQLDLAVDDARRACGLDALARKHPVMLVCAAGACGLVAGVALARPRPAPPPARTAAPSAPPATAPAGSPWIGLLIQTLAAGLGSWLKPPPAEPDADLSHQHQQPGAQP